MKRIFLSIILIALSAAISFAENPSVLYMIGGATEGSWDWAKATEMMPVSGQDEVYSWTGNLSASDFKICAEKDVNWSGTVPFYRPTYANCEISKNGVADSKVVYTTSPDDKWNVVDAGQYTITINITTLTISATYLGAIPKEPIVTETLYLIGGAAPCGWDINNLTPCDKKENNVFVYNGELKADYLQASLTQYDWNAKFIVPVDFTTLPQADGNINGVCMIPNTGLKNNEFNYTTDHTKAWKIEEEGNYTLTFDLNNWTLTVSNNVESGVSELVTDKNAPVEYYNLQGVRVEDPANGLYLVRKGGKVSKVMIK